MGEPAGISAEITLKVWKKYRNKLKPFIFFGDPNHISQTASNLNYKVPVKIIKNIKECFDIFKNYLPIYKISLNKKNIYGKPSINNSDKVLYSIKKVVNLATKKKISSIVTNPIEKNIISKKNKNFSGHTFYIANLLGIKKPIMLLTSPKISVVPITQHMSLKKAIKVISKELIISTVKITNEYLKKYFNMKKPKIGIAGLNPHLGENGNFGKEEQKIILPAIKEIKKKGIDINGPYPADTIFTKNFLKKFNVVICMYHDQATMPIKIIDFDNGVNITLGLPIIRTSPDHGTALNISGKNKASEKSLYSAIKLSQEIAKKKKFWIQ